MMNKKTKRKNPPSKQKEDFSLQTSHFLIPRLRFPEFRAKGEWEAKPLGEMCDRIVEKVGDTPLTPVSITAGKGFVSQVEKFGRDISGAQYKNYIWLRQGDFSYNKGNSKSYPQGCVRRLKEFDQAAAPSAFISFRLHGGYVPEFFEGLFEKNTHGRQLIRFITSGARSDGLLNISPEEFFSVNLPIPQEPPEQQKIAECLSSLDGSFAAGGRMLEALKAHKKGLMQQLFPQPGQTQPRLRFPEFRDKWEWGESPLGKLLSRKPEYGVNAAAVAFSEDLPIYIRITDIDDEGQFTQDKRMSVDIEATEENYLVEGDIVLARTGASVGKSYRYRQNDGRLVFAGFLIRMRPNSKKLVPDFLSSYLTTGQYWDWVRVNSARSGQPGINGSEYASMPVPLPPAGRKGNELAEQQRIADCLTALDTRIAAQAAKIETLKQHKRGLMQQLFPK